MQMSHRIVGTALIVVLRLFLQHLLHNMPRLRLGDDLKLL